MKTADFHFDLPPELIASYPLPNREDSRLMAIDGHTGAISHHHFPAILDLVQAGDLMVFNDTRVIPARLYGKKATGGQVEVLIERVLDNHTARCQLKVSKVPQPGSYIYFENGMSLKVQGRHAQFYDLSCDTADATIWEIIDALGEIPLPHYMQREPDESDKERYQTIYAKHKGSVAAPTAGFHFTDRIFQALRDKNVQLAFLTLHIGAGTFTPVRADDLTEHQMHAEYIHVTENLCQQIRDTKARGKRVIAVGTTALRALESASANGETVPFEGDTNIFIYPGYQFQCIDALVTNLHLPCSTLMMLVSALGGYDTMMQAYKIAVQERYRFFSYGDAMFITRKENALTPD